VNSAQQANFWTTNLLVAYAAIDALPKRMFVRNLDAWRIESEWCDAETHECGTPACFGGWIARILYFQKLGIYAAYNGSPRLQGSFDSSFGAALFLFGAEHLFNPRQPDEKGSGRKIIIKRIEAQLKDLHL
jgi:hypothetical protein